MPPKHAHRQQGHNHQGHNQQGHNQQHQNHEELSEEDKKILEEAHKNKDNPNHPAHKDHPEHHNFMKKIPKKLGGAALFGVGASAGSSLFHSLAG